MKRLLLLFCSSIFLLIFPHAVFAGQMPNFIVSDTFTAMVISPTPRVGNEIIVNFKEPPTAKILLSVTKQNGRLSPKYGISSSNLMVYKVQEGTPKEAILDILSNQFVQSAFPNYLLSLFTLPNDPAIIATPLPGKPRIQWDMFNMKLADETSGVWDKTTGSSSITVAIIDSGIDSAHPEIAGKTGLADCSINPCQMVTSMTDNPNRQFIHGTHVAGIVAAATNNNVGIAGAGYNSRIMMVKVMEENGEVSIDNLLRALNYIADHKSSDNIKVINMSLGQLEGLLDPQAIDAMHTAVQRVSNAGIVLVAAAGNSGRESNSKSYPAAFPEVIAVAAMGVDNRLASYSAYNDDTSGNWISVAAPGGECAGVADIYNCIASLVPANAQCSVPVGSLGTVGYCYMAGTSQASPHVAALAGLIASVNPNLTAGQIKQIIEVSANKLYPTGSTGATKYGGVDGLAAVLAAMSDAHPSVTPLPSLSPTVPPSLPSISPTAASSPTVTFIPTSIPTSTPLLTPVCPIAAQSCTATKGGGDADCDGSITQCDFTIWNNEFKGNLIGKNADFTEDGKVDLMDYEIWRRSSYK